jgi:hypothetical protein
MRRDGELSWKGREVAILDPDRLSQRIGRLPTRVSSLPFARVTASRES